MLIIEIIVRFHSSGLIPLRCSRDENGVVYISAKKVEKIA